MARHLHLRHEMHHSHRHQQMEGVLLGHLEFLLALLNPPYEVELVPLQVEGVVDRVVGSREVQVVSQEGLVE